MDYTVGSHIPEKAILRRFKDEDGEIFLEVRGIEGAYYRVNSGNQVFYKIDKALMAEEELNLIDDFSNKWMKMDSEPVLELEEYEADEPVIEMKPEMLMKEEFIRPNPEDDEIEVNELEEGQLTPRYLRPLCKRTAYDGYSLRYGKFLYMLDKDYRVEMKTPDSVSSYMLGVEDKISSLKSSTVQASPPLEPPPIPISLEFDLPEKDTNINLEMKDEFEKGDLLPASLRDRCEKDMVTEGGRIIFGNYLYLLDLNYIVTTKMKLTYSEEDATDAVSLPADTSQENLPIEEIVANMVKHFEIGLDKYNINADFFKESVLGDGNRAVLFHVYEGDLTILNDNTREAASKRKLTVLKTEKGFTLLRAAILHELYIKSTLAGRGNNMKFYITHILSLQPDGRVKQSQDDWPLEKQQKLLDFFNDRASVYTDKADLIRQLYRNLRNTIFKDFKAIRDIGGNVSFNAFLIVKLYELTNRLDRGDGITMIRLSRDIMNYK